MQLNTILPFKEVFINAGPVSNWKLTHSKSESWLIKSCLEFVFLVKNYYLNIPQDVSHGLEYGCYFNILGINAGKEKQS